MIEPDHTWPKRLTLMAASLTAAVSAALFVSLIVRDLASLNYLNMSTLIGTTAGAGVAFRFHYRTTWFVWGYLLFVVALIAAVPSVILLLYVPPLITLTLAAAIRVTSGTRR